MDKLSKVIEFFDMSCDCECCGTYTDYYAHLDCGHGEIVDGIYKPGDIVRCSECSGDYDE